MKRIVILSLCLLASAGSWATNQPRSLGNTKVSRLVLEPLTLAQINALQPDTTGQIVPCSDCTTSTHCVSSGAVTTTSIGAFVVFAATGAFVGANYSGMPHCK